MTVREYIDNNLQPLSANSLVDDAISYLAKNSLPETFIFSGEKELRLIRMADIISEEGTDLAILFATPFELKLVGNMHWSQLLTIFNNLNIQILPVYDRNFYFVGLLSKAHLVSNIADLRSLEEPGAMLQLECDPAFYSASEVIRIAETYNARVLALFVHHQQVTQKLMITLKINLQETKGIASTFERFGYEVSNVFMNMDFNHDVYQDRYESFLRVLDMK